MRARSRHPHTASTRIIGWLLVFVLAQTLSWVHRGLHAMPHGAPSPVAGHVLAPQAVGDHASHSWAERLFAGHTQASDCQLFDALTHADGAPASLLTLGLLPAVVLRASASGAAAGGCAVPFDARGPPLSLNT